MIQQQRKKHQQLLTHGLLSHSTLVRISRRLVVVRVRDQACAHTQNGEGLNLQMGSASVNAKGIL